MPFDILGYKNKFADYFGDAPLDEIAKDAYERGGYSESYPDFDTWKMTKGIDELIRQDNLKRNPLPPMTFWDKLTNATNHVKPSLDEEPTLFGLPRGFKSGLKQGVGVVGGALQSITPEDSIISQAGKSLTDYAEKDAVPPEKVGFWEKGAQLVGLMAPVMVAGALAPQGAATTAVGATAATLFGLSQKHETEKAMIAKGLEPGMAPWLTGLATGAVQMALPGVLGRTFNPAVAKLVGQDMSAMTVKDVIRPSAGAILKEFVTKTVPTTQALFLAQTGSVAAIEDAYGVPHEIAKELWETAKSAAAFSVLHGVGGMPIRRMVDNVHLKQLSEKIDIDNLDKTQISKLAKTRYGYVDAIGKALEKAGDTDIAAGWRDYAIDQVRYNEPIDITQSLDALAEPFLAKRRAFNEILDEGMTTGKVGETDFTTEHALEIMKLGRRENVFDDAQIDALKEKYPDLRDGANEIIAEETQRKVEQVQSARDFGINQAQRFLEDPKNQDIDIAKHIEVLQNRLDKEELSDHQRGFYQGVLDTLSAKKTEKPITPEESLKTGEPLKVDEILKEEPIKAEEPIKDNVVSINGPELSDAERRDIDPSGTLTNEEIKSVGKDFTNQKDMDETHPDFNSDLGTIQTKYGSDPINWPNVPANPYRNVDIQGIRDFIKSGKSEPVKDNVVQMKPKEAQPLPAIKIGDKVFTGRPEDPKNHISIVSRNPEINDLLEKVPDSKIENGWVDEHGNFVTRLQMEQQKEAKSVGLNKGSIVQIASKGLTKTQIDKIRNFAGGASPNSELRTDTKLSPYNKATVAVLDKVFRKIPGTDQDMVVYHSRENFDGIPDVGETFTDKGFTSTSLSKTAHDETIKSLADETGVTYKSVEVRLPKGTKVLPLSGKLGSGKFDYQDEGLLPKDTEFRVVSKTVDGVVLEVIPKSDAKFATSLKSDGPKSAVTVDDVRSFFKNQEVIQPGGEGKPIYVRTNGGQYLSLELVDRIDPDKMAFKVAYGRDYDPSKDTISGQYDAGNIELVRNDTGKMELAHESIHFIEDAGILTPHEVGMIERHIKNLVEKGEFKSVNKDQIGGSEDRAVFLSKVLSGERPATGLLGRIVFKIQEFIDKMVNAFGKRTVSGIVRDIDTGKIFDRSGVTPENNPKMYALQQRLKPFFSQLDKVVGQKVKGTMQANDLRKMLRNNGVTEDEIQSLVGTLNGKVTKQQILEEIQVNTTEFKDEILSGNKMYSSDRFFSSDPHLNSLIRQTNSENLPLDQMKQVIRTRLTRMIDEYEDKVKKSGIPENYRNYDNQTLHQLRSAYDKIEDIQEEVHNNPTHYGDYVEPGAKEGSYREMFVTAPSIGKKERISDNRAQELYDAGLITDIEANNREIDSGSWRDGHGPYDNIQNPIVRIRFNEREIDGKRILFVEEMQGPSEANQEKMPEALKKRIYDIGVKRVLTYAKENGFDGVSWTTGKMQVDRYSLAKQIKSLRWENYGEGKEIEVIDNTGESLFFKTENGRVLSDDRLFRNKSLEEVVGKEAANRIQNNFEGELKGLDLEIGGEGLKELYNNRIPNLFKKYGKGEIETVSFNKVEVPYIPITDKIPQSFPQYSVKTAVVDLLTPGADAAKGIKQGLQSLILPTAKSLDHLKAAEVVGKYLGSMNRDNANASLALKRDEMMFTKMGVHDETIPLTTNPGMQFASDVSQGRRLTPQMQGISDRIKSISDRLLDALDKAGVPLQTVRDNYFPGMWTKESIRAYNQAMKEAIDQGIGAQGSDVNLWTPQQKTWVKARTDELLKDKKGSDVSALSYLTKTPFKGKETFRKEKTFDDVMTAVEFGLRPVSANPIDLVKLKFAEIGRSVMANRALREFEAKGDIINVNNSGVPLKKNLIPGYDPKEWAPINDKYGTIWHVNPDTHMLEKIGNRMARRPVADILNNYLSSSIYNSPYFGQAFKSYMTVAHTLNQTQLGILSAFHAGFTTIDVSLSQVTNSIKDAYGVLKGNRTVGDLVKSTAMIPIAAIHNPMEGAKILKEWETPTMNVPADVPVGQLPQTKEAHVAMIARASEIAGGGFRMERGLKTEWQDKAIREWYGGHKLKAALRSPVVFTELCAKPILEWLVPRQKAGVFGEIVGRLVEMNPNKSLNDLTPELRQAWNRVDARLGQVQYDRLFINNVAKNTIQALVRAPGWSGGTIAEVGGAFTDAGAFLREWTKTGKMPDNLPDRVAYAIGLMGGMAIINGALSYAFTGEKPKDLDFWAFRDGSKDERGKPSRWLLPSYQKDIYHYMESPGKVILAKAHPMIGLIGDILRNQDFYGVRITNSEDPLLTKAAGVASYGLKQFVPFWIRGAQKEAEKGGGFERTFKESPQKLIAPQMGIMPASSVFTSTEFEKYARNLRDQSTKTSAEFEHTKVKNQLTMGILRGDPDARQNIIEAKNRKLITNRDAADIIKHAKEHPLLRAARSLTLQELLLGVQNYATDEEKKVLIPVLMKKYRSNLDILNLEDKIKYRQQINELRSNI